MNRAKKQAYRQIFKRGVLFAESGCFLLGVSMVKYSFWCLLKTIVLLIRVGDQIGYPGVQGGLGASPRKMFGKGSLKVLNLCLFFFWS